MHRFQSAGSIPQLLSIALLCSAQAAFAAPDPALLEGLSARAIGPAAVSGRISSIDAVASNPNHIVIGAVTINQANPDIIWVGTGEGNVRNSTSIGSGMFKSVDGGRSWQAGGLEGTERIERIVAARRDVDTLLDWLDNDPGTNQQALREQAGKLRERLDTLEQRFRVPPGTKGIVYDDDRVVSRIGPADAYVSSSHAPPTPTAMDYVETARRALAEGTTAVDFFMNEDVSTFSTAADAASIGLFRGTARD